MKPTRNDSVLAFIAAHPGCTTHDIAADQGYSPSNAAATCSFLASSGRVTRREVRRIASNRPVYAYWTADAAIPASANWVSNVCQPKPSAPQPGFEQLGGLLDTLAGLIATTLAGKVKEQLSSQLRTLLPAAVPESIVAANEAGGAPLAIQQQPSSNPGENPRIGLVGLWPNQIVEIEKEFSESFNLKIWREGDWNQLKAIAVHCEAVFVMAKQISHKISNHLETNNATTYDIHGRLDALRIALYEYHMQRKAA